MTALYGFQLSLNQLDTAFAAGAVAGARCVDGHIGPPGQFQQIISGVAIDGYGIGSLDLEGYFHTRKSFR